MVCQIELNKLTAILLTNMEMDNISLKNCCAVYGFSLLFTQLDNLYN